MQADFQSLKCENKLEKFDQVSFFNRQTTP